MSLLNFFAQQRKHWRSQPDDRSVEHLAGGLAALDQAEAAFKATPIYNAHQQVADVQRELDEVSYKLSLARKEIHVLGSQVGSLKQRASEVVVAQELLDNVRLHRNRMRSARKVMHRILEAVTDQYMQPDAKFGKILEVVRRFQTAIHKSEEGEGEPDDGA